MRPTIAAMLLLSAPLVAPAQEKLEQAWLDEVAALKPAEQVKAVGAKLRQLNIQFAGGVSFKEAGGKVVELAFRGNGVKNIAPLAVLKHLKKLDFAGTAPTSEADKERVKDLTPLHEMQLEVLDMSWCDVGDLGPLRGMPLRVFKCNSCREIDSLAALEGAPLVALECRSCTALKSLAPLKGAPLTDLDCSNTRVADFAPLQGAPLKK